MAFSTRLYTSLYISISLPTIFTSLHFPISFIFFSCASGSRSANTSSISALTIIVSSRPTVWSSLMSRSVFTILLSLSFCSVTIFIVCMVSASLPGCLPELYKSSWICINDNGVRSSCAAFSVNCLCILNASDRRSSILLYETLSLFSSLTWFSSIWESDRFCNCTSSILSENSPIGLSARPLIKYVTPPPRSASKTEIIKLFLL